MAALHFSIYAVVGVGAVLLVLLVHPVTTLIMMGVIASVIVFLMGEMWILGLRFNRCGQGKLYMSEDNLMSDQFSGPVGSAVPAVAGRCARNQPLRHVCRPG